MKIFMLKKALLLLLFLTPCMQLFGADYYWVGGAGSWSDINHWVTTSGGSTIHSIVPGPNDDVYFDANSGLATGNIVTLPTAGHAYCRNMSWNGVTTNASFRNNSSFNLHIYGSLELANSVRYGMGDFYFEGPANASFTLNGAIRVGVGWFHSAIVNKPGGMLTITDDIVAAFACWIYFTEGTLDMSGNTYTLRAFESNNSNTRNLNISNASITVDLDGAWDYRGSNKAITAAGSFIQAEVFHSDGFSYPEVVVTSTYNTMSINNTTFNKLTYTNPASVPGSVRIGANNTVTRLEFMGGGCIRSNGNIIDSLIVAPGKGILLFDTAVINSYFSHNTPACSGVGEIFATTSTPAVMSFGAGVVFDLDNVYITNMTATGAVTLPVNVPGADGGNNTNWNFLNPPTGTTLYWVGGAGNWNDSAHWSATSGGTGGYCIPFLADNVIFDANSGFGPGNNTVTTSANAWCHNMTWTGVTGNPVLNESTTYKLEVWGSVVLDNTVTMNAELVLRGADSSWLESNGSTLGNLNIVINKENPTGGLTLQDDLIHTSTFLRLSSGKLLLPGRTMHIQEFVSSTGVRTIDITNATVVTDTGWTLTGSGRTWIGNAAGSSLTSHGVFTIDGLTYPDVLLTAATYPFSIANATLGTLRFSNTSPSSTARIQNNNTIDSLLFSGAGRINNTGNSINTLLLAPSRIYYFSGTTTINSLLDFVSPLCSGLGEMRGLGTGGTISFGAAAAANMDNIYLLNMTATGNIAPISLSGADAGGNTGFNITSAAGGNRYWVGGSGDWNDNSHWALTSGGAGGACIPTVNDNVFFDANSFTAAATVTSVTGNAYCHTMNWYGATNTPVFNKSAAFDMEIWGNLIMNPAVTMNALVLFRGASDDTLTVNGSTSGDFDFTALKQGGNLRVAGNIINPLTRIELLAGGLNLAGDTMVVEGISDVGVSTPTSLDISNSTITSGWNYSGSNKNLTAAGSYLTIPGSHTITVNGGVYNDVDVTIANASNMNISNTVFNTLIFSNSSTTSGARILAGNTIGYLEYKGRGAVSGTGNEIDTLVFSPGRVYSFANSTTTTINDAWYGSGTPCNLTEIISPAGAAINMTSGNVEFDYIRVQNITAGGNTPFTALQHSINLGGNTNWNIAPYNGTAPIYGLGSDTAILAGDFPYTLTTEGFFGSPLSQYLWNDSSALDNLVINDTGSYYVTVSFVDGCTVSDTIHISLAVPLPITLSHFSATSGNCAVMLDWKVSEAKEFHHFEVERSLDGISYVQLSRVAFDADKNTYTYSDRSVTGGDTYYYRLKLSDIDEKYTYSIVKQVSVHCRAANDWHIYPNPVVDQEIRIQGIDDITSVKILNLSGVVLYEQNISRPNPGILAVPVRVPMESGVYILQLQTTNGTLLHKRFLKK